MYICTFLLHHHRLSLLLPPLLFSFAISRRDLMIKDMQEEIRLEQYDKKRRTEMEAEEATIRQRQLKQTRVILSRHWTAYANNILNLKQEENVGTWLKIAHFHHFMMSLSPSSRFYRCILVGTVHDLRWSTRSWFVVRHEYIFVSLAIDR